MKNLHNEIVSTIDEIYGHLKNTKDLGISLMEGMPGVILFMQKYAVLKKNVELLVICESLIEDQVIEFLNTTQERIPSSFCDGLVGVLAFCDYMSSHNGKHYFDLDEDLLDYLADLIITDFSKDGEYDFLHGGLGTVYYLIRKYKLNANENERNKISELLHLGLDLFKDLAILDQQGCRWNFPVDNDKKFTGKPLYNLGTAHGLPGILNILSELYSLNINKKVSGFLAHETFKFIINCKSKSEITISQFQSYYSPEHPLPYDSRLAWCYGDLGLSISLHKAGRLLNDKKMVNQSIAIALKTISRKEEQESLVMDASFCHGSAGVAHMYGIFYEYTCDVRFSEIQDYWTSKTLKFSNTKENPLGFKMHIEDDLWSRDLGMMKGISGIGLSLISYLTGDRDWDSFFLLD